MNGTDGRYYLISTAKSLKLDLPIPHELMLLEAKQLREYFTRYRTDDSTYFGWHTLTLYGVAYDKGHSWEEYGFPSANDSVNHLSWTEIIDKCPVTINWLKTVFPTNRYGRVRFMLLEAGGNIGLHTDTEYSILENVNIALNNPDGCEWHWGDGTTLGFKPGDAYAVNISYPHRVSNNSQEDRYHIIIHHHDSTPAWIEMMTKALKENNEQGKFVYSEELY
jgi:hypothetical protein